MNYIWAGLLIIGFIIGILNGRLEEVTQAAFSSAGRAVELSIGLLGIMCLWSGLMKIMQKSGMVKAIAKAAQPFLRLLFPELVGNSNAMGAIVMNMAANFMGMGNAATPLGIKAMDELQKVNIRKDTATDAMCMFLVLNTSAIQLIPATIIAIRTDAGSAAPAEITSCIWAASLCASAAGIIAVRIMSLLRKPGRHVGKGVIEHGDRFGTISGAYGKYRSKFRNRENFTMLSKNSYSKPGYGTVPGYSHRSGSGRSSGTGQ